jgi:hypothetical protein
MSNILDYCLAEVTAAGTTSTSITVDETTLLVNCVVSSLQSGLDTFFLLHSVSILYMIRYTRHVIVCYDTRRGILYDILLYPLILAEWRLSEALDCIMLCFGGKAPSRLGSVCVRMFSPTRSVMCRLWLLLQCTTVWFFFVNE